MLISGRMGSYTGPFGFGFKSAQSTKQDSTNSKTTSLLLWNIEGLKSAFSTMPDNNILRNDILILTETFLTDSTHIEGFYSTHSLATQGQRGRPSGGITCMIKPWLAPLRVVHKTENTIVLRIKNATIIGCYFQPDFNAQGIIDVLSEAIGKTDKDDPVILAGDLNCRADTPNRKSKSVFSFLEEEGLKLITNKEPTYICHNGASTIDLIFANKRVKLYSQEVETMSGAATIRKHIPVLANFTTPTAVLTDASTKPARFSRQLDKTMLQTSAVGIQTIMGYIEEGRLNEASLEAETVIRGALVPARDRERKAKVWFDAECYAQRRSVLQALHNAKATRAAQDFQDYAQNRRIYKLLIMDKKSQYAEKEARKKAEAARVNPFQAQKARQPRFPHDIPMETWMEHFSKVLNKNSCQMAYEIIAQSQIPLEFSPFTRQEVEKAINETKSNKAAGPDGIFNEHIKDAKQLLLDIWTRLFNECMKRGNIPDSWRESTIKVLYKGKGDTSTPDAYRGIALENNIFKIFSRLLTKRITEKIDILIPEHQFGFRRGRSTIHAVTNLLNDIDDAIRIPRGKFYAVFIDYTKAFDYLSRQKLVQKLQHMLGEGSPLWTIVTNILAVNKVRINDGTSTSDSIIQTNGVLQGDPLSPLLFNAATADIVKAVLGENSPVALYMYADDMVMGAKQIEDLQRAFDKLIGWTKDNLFNINMNKTVQMTFRNGGRTAKKDVITNENGKLEIVNDFKYLGIHLQSTRTSFRIHIKDRAIAAIKAFQDISRPDLLDIKTALILFDAKITPILTYGIHIVWNHLTVGDLATMEKVKASYLKRILCVSKFTASRLVYELASECFLIEVLRSRLLLPSTAASDQLLRQRIEKRESIWPEFYATDAMLDKEWTHANFELRHLVTRLAVHGFHHKICCKKTFHVPNQECVCKLCNGTCDRYHIVICTKRTQSMSEFCKDT